VQNFSLSRDEDTVGRGERIGDSRGLGRKGHGGSHGGLELDGRQASESVLGSTLVVGPFDPGHDRQAQFLEGVPASLVEDVGLQE